MPGQDPQRVQPRRRFLVFCRNYLVPDFRDNVAPTRDEFEFDFLTDGASRGTRDTRKPFYAALRAGTRSAEIDAATESDVIARCRLLRNIDAVQARRMVHAMACVLAAELDRCRPDAVLCHWVDEYVTHLLSILSARRGSRFVGYAYSYFPKRVQLVQRADGLAFDVREPNDEEVGQTLQTISPQAFRQNYAQAAHYSRWRHGFGVLRYGVKRAVFATKSVLQRDPWNLHYAVTPYIVERRRLSDFPSASLFETDWRAALGRHRQCHPRRPVVYLPLAYFPESSTDYWVADKSILDYEAKVIEIVRSLVADCVVVVKEHLHMMGGRRPAFYARLREREPVLSVHPAQVSNEVLADCDAVVVGGGSVGVESFVRGKPVFSYCDNSFWFAPSGAFRLDLAATQEWAGQIRAQLAQFRPADDRRKHEFVRQCLRSTVRPRPGARRWLLMDEADLRALLRVA